MVRLVGLSGMTVALLVACDSKKDATTFESSQQKAAKSNADSAPDKPALPPQEFQVGRWSGTTALKLTAEGDDASKKEDEAGVSPPSEPLSVELSVDDAGSVSGEASSGAERAQLAGVYDDSQIRVHFSGPRMTGTGLLVRKDSEFRGTVRLSLLSRSESGEQFLPLVAELALQKKE